MSEKKNSFFAISEINTESYKESMTEISKGMKNLYTFTDNLQKKVDGLLKAQETQFVLSYKQHMFLIKEEFRKLEYEMKKKEALVSEYENEGKMSNLLKRVSFLENQQKKHLNTIQKKSQELRALILEKNMILSENKRLEQKIKQLIREKTKAEDKIIHYNIESSEHMPTFSTEISPSKSRDKLSKMMTQERSIDRSGVRKSERTQFSLNPEISSQYNRLQKQIKSLKRQNRELVTFNSKFMEGNTTMQNFFIEVVNEIKKNITARKQTKQCSLQDFRKEDKLELLIRVLSNDDILVHLHEKIFGEKKKIDQTEPRSFKVIPSDIKDKIRILRSANNQFPSINSTRLN